MTDTASIDEYFAHARREIEPLLPNQARRVLEIGCSSGATLAWLKQRWPNVETFGVDGYAPLEKTIQSRADHALIHDLDHPLPDIGTFDLILALDVLEHLRDPQSVLNDLSSRLAPGGVCIVSVPNIANYKVLAPLLFMRRFRYVTEGILDRTHLRWFTEESARSLMADAGLGTTAGLITGFIGGRQRVFNALTFGLFKHYLTQQYIMRGETGAAQSFRWKTARSS